MSLLVILCVLIAIALAAPFLGADTRFPGAGDRPDRPWRGKRYRWNKISAISEEVRRDQFDRTT